MSSSEPSFILWKSAEAEGYIIKWFWHQDIHVFHNWKLSGHVKGCHSLSKLVYGKTWLLPYLGISASFFLAFTNRMVSTTWRLNKTKLECRVNAPQIGIKGIPLVSLADICSAGWNVLWGIWQTICSVGVRVVVLPLRDSSPLCQQAALYFVNKLYRGGGYTVQCHCWLTRINVSFNGDGTTLEEQYQVTELLRPNSIYLDRFYSRPFFC